MIKYDINKFYVGELHLSRKLGNLLIRTKLSDEERKQIEIRLITKSNGAVEVDNYVNWNIRRDYVILFSLFYEKNGQYICLHNNEEYDLNGFDCCKNLVTLSSILPKVSLNISNELSVKSALNLFDNLFNNKLFNINKLYDKKNYDINDFYLGYLNLYTSYRLYEQDDRILYNIPQSLLIYNSDAKWVGFMGTDEIKNDIITGVHDYHLFKTLFLKLPNNNLYNLHNFYEYNIGIMENKKFERYDDGISYYDRIVPFSSILKKNNIVFSQNVNIAKILKLYNKIK